MNMVFFFLITVLIVPFKAQQELRNTNTFAKLEINNGPELRTFTFFVQIC